MTLQRIRLQDADFTTGRPGSAGRRVSGRTAKSLSCAEIVQGSSSLRGTVVLLRAQHTSAHGCDVAWQVKEDIQRAEDVLLVAAAARWSQQSLARVWDNPDDAAYDEL